MNTKLIKRFAAVFAAVCLLCMTLAVTVSALPEEKKTGSITVEMNSSMEGLGFTIVDIGRLQGRWNCDHRRYVVLGYENGKPQSP